MVLFNTVAQIQAVAERGEDVWEMVVSAGIQAQDGLDTGRWVIGDLALLVVKSYGDDTIGEFATAINVEKGRVQEYRTICKFWEPGIRAGVLADFPNLTYSHLREAKRMGNMQAALAIVEEAATAGWTIEGMRLEINTRLGTGGGRKKLLDAQMVIQQVEPRLLILDADTSEQDLTDVLPGDTETVRVVIYSVPEEEREDGSATYF